MRTRAKGNVLDAISFPMGGVVLENNITIVGTINLANVDPNGAAAPAFIIDGDATHLFPAGREFVITGGSNAGQYIVDAPGAMYNKFPTLPHKANTTEIPTTVAPGTYVPPPGPDGTMSGYGIDLDGTIISNSGTPDGSDILEVANVDYVDNAAFGPANLAPGTYAIDISGTADNANLLDGLDSTAFFKLDPTGTPGTNTTNGNITIAHSANPHLIINDTGTLGDPYIQFLTQGSAGGEGGAILQNVNSTGSGYVYLRRYNSVAGAASTIILYENGNITIDPTGAGTTTNAGNFNVTGAIVATGNITAFSDIRLKEDIKTIDNAMDKIVQIGGYTFTRNDLDDDKRYAGVIAQEVQHVLPEVIERSEDGMLSVAYGNLVALLIEGMKEQKKEIDDLKKRLDKVEE